MKTIIIEKINVLTEEGNTLKGNVYFPSQPNNNTILIAPNIGKSKNYYQGFSEFLVNQGFLVYNFDYSGIRDSNSKPIHRSNATLLKWGSVDINAMLKFIKYENPKNQIIFIGHKIGGHLVGFAENKNLISKVIFIGNQFSYWKDWPNKLKFPLFFFWYILLPVLTNVLGYFPASKIFLEIDIPKTVALEWRNWTKSRYGLFTCKKSFFFNKELSVPMLLCSFSDDIANQKSFESLKKIFSKSNIENLYFKGRDCNKSNLTHLDFFETELKSQLWNKLIQWLKKDEVYLIKR